MIFFKASQMSMTLSELKAIRVFFDSQCPLCSREIDFYQQQEGADHIDWVDVTKVDPDKLPYDLTQAGALARFHVVTANGSLVSGGRAFSSLWLSLSKFKWAGQLFSISLLASILEIAYRAFLPCRPLIQRLLQQTFPIQENNLETYKTKK